MTQQYALGVLSGFADYTEDEEFQAHLQAMSADRFEKLRQAVLAECERRNVDPLAGTKTDYADKIEAEWNRKDELGAALAAIVYKACHPARRGDSFTIKVWARGADKRIYLSWGSGKTLESFLDFYFTGNRRNKPNSIETYGNYFKYEPELLAVLKEIAKLPDGEKWTVEPPDLKKPLEG